MQLTNDCINLYLKNILNEYQVIPVAQLLGQLSINSKAKHLLNILTQKMVNKVSPEILRDDIVFKIVRLDRYGKLKEAMSLPTFKYCEIVKENWYGSKLRNYLSEKKLIFAVYQYVGGELYLRNFIVWQPSDDVLDKEMKTVWEKTKEAVASGKIVKYIDDRGRYVTYFPKAAENFYMHVRPHAQTKRDTFPLPVPDKLTGLMEYAKYSFWLNRFYVLKIVSQGGKL